MVEVLQVAASVFGVGAKGVYSVGVTEDEPFENSGRVGRVGWYKLVQVP